MREPVYMGVYRDTAAARGGGATALIGRSNFRPILTIRNLCAGIYRASVMRVGLIFHQDTHAQDTACVIFRLYSYIDISYHKHEKLVQNIR